MRRIDNDIDWKHEKIKNSEWSWWIWIRVSNIDFVFRKFPITTMMIIKTRFILYDEKSLLIMLHSSPRWYYLILFHIILISYNFRIIIFTTLSAPFTTYSAYAHSPLLSSFILKMQIIIYLFLVSPVLHKPCLLWNYLELLRNSSVNWFVNIG